MAYIIYNKTFKEIYSKRINDFCGFEQIINEYVQQDKLENLHIILPTHRIIKYLQFQLINKYYLYHKKPLSNYNIYNLEDFTNLLFNHIFKISESQEISDALRLIIFEEAYSKADLEFFNKNNNRAKYEIIRRLNELVYGIREDGFDKEQAEIDLQSIATGHYPEEIESNKYSDILKILIEYENILGDKVFDKPAKLQKIIGFLNSQTTDELLEFYNKLFKNGELVLAYGFSEFKMPEVELLSYFATASTPFALILDFSPDNGPLFGNFFDYIEKFFNNGFEIYSDDKIFEESDQYLSMEGYDNYFFRKHLFHFDNNDIIHLNKPINIIEAQNPRDEVSKIAKLIKYLNIKKGIELKDIAIVSRRPDDYSDYFREIFRIENIPANITDRYKLWKSPIVNKIYAFIEFAINGYKINILKRLFNNTSVEFNFKVDINNIVFLANELRIQPRFYPVTAEYWLKTLEQSRSFYQNLLTNIDDLLEVSRLKKLITKIEQGINDIKSIQVNMQIVSEKLSGKEFRNFIVNDIILKFKFNDYLRQKVKKILEITNGSPNFLFEDIEKEARGLQEFLKVVNDIANLYELRSKEKLTLKEWYERLKIGVFNERYQITEKMNNSVDITSIEQIRYLPYKVKILCGTSDSIFPTAYSPEKLFGKELLDAKQKHIRAERVLFYQFLSSSKFLFKNNEEGEIYIFYPKTIQGYQTPPSPFIDSLKSIVEYSDENILDVDESNSRFSAITNESELFYYLGKNYDQIFNIIDNSIDNKELNNIINNYIKTNNLTCELSYHKEIKPFNKENLLNVKLNENLIAPQYLDKSYSISELETYAKCPYKYYSKYILHIDEVRKRELTLEPIELGNFLHKILYEFYNELIKNDISTELLQITNLEGETIDLKCVKLNPSSEKVYTDLLIKIAQKILEMPVKDYQILNYQIRQLIDFSYARNLLLNWLKNELRKEDWLFLPAFFEKQFEADLKPHIETSNLDISHTLFNKSIKVNGKIDRIEVNSTDNVLEFAVADYKLSAFSVPKINDIISQLTSFQIPIYMLGFRQYLSNYHKIKSVPAFGVYYLLNPSNKNHRRNTIVLANKDLDSVKSLPKTDIKLGSVVATQEELLSNSLRQAIEIKDRIVNGLFTVAPINEDEVCTYCPYYTMCKIRQL